MSNAELTVKIGHVEFQARGTQDWLAEQLRYVVELSERAGPTSPILIDEVKEREPDRHTEDDSSDRWVSRHGFSRAQLDQIFDRGQRGFEIIVGEPPGASLREKVINTYLLVGTKALLASGEPAFEDKEARSFCENYGCFDSKKHAEYLKSAGNKFSGDKTKGWRLTAPGMSAAAALVKQFSI